MLTRMAMWFYVVGGWKNSCHRRSILHTGLEFIWVRLLRLLLRKPVFQKSVRFVLVLVVMLVDANCVDNFECFSSVSFSWCCLCICICPSISVHFWVFRVRIKAYVIFAASRLTRFFLQTISVVGLMISSVEVLHSAAMVVAALVHMQFHCPCLTRIIVWNYHRGLGL